MKKLLLALALVSIAQMYGQGGGQSQPNSSAQDPTKGPIADYDRAASMPSDPVQQSVRQARNDRYDIHDPQMTPDKVRQLALGEGSGEEIGQLPLTHSYEEPLPTGKSGTIVIGTIKDAHSYLSNQRVNIYSEFQLQVEQVLKGDRVGAGEVIDIERYGGRIRLKSGKVLTRSVSDHTMPLLGKRYLLFLEQDLDTQDFRILTGYQLEGARVFPLDGNDLPQFAPYRAATEEQLLAETRAKIVHQPASISPTVGGR